MPAATDDQIVRLFRFLLGRNPSGAEVRRKAELGLDFQALRKHFLASHEFLFQNHRHIMTRILNEHLDHPMGPIEIDIPEDDLAVLVDHMHRTWTKLGETEPYFSVVSRPQFASERFDQHRTAFDASGKRTFDAVLKRFRFAGLEPSQEAVCMELGCGVGRVTPLLASHFHHVYAVDISESHLKLCAEHLQQLGCANVTVLQVLPQVHENPYPEHDCFFSSLVLQHNPPPVAAHMLRQCLERLRPGGIGLFQVMTYQQGFSFNAQEYLDDLQAHARQKAYPLPQSEVYRLAQETRCAIIDQWADRSLSRYNKDKKLCLSSFFTVVKSSDGS